MNQAIESCMAGLNEMGRGFCNYAGAMLVQSGLLVVLLLIVDVVIRKRVRATVRYWLWILVFAKLLLPPTLSLPTGIGSWGPEAVSMQIPALERVSTHTVRPEPAPSPTPEAATTTFASTPTIQPLDVRPETTVLAPPVAAASTQLTWQAGCLLLWTVGVLVFGVLVMQRVFFVRWLMAQSGLADPGLLDALESCRRRLGVRRDIAVRVSPEAFSPAVCGLFRPTILVPAAVLEKLSVDDLRAVLIHEVAHIKRGDLWLHSAQTLLQIVYFYNPFVWLANARVRGIRERAVDETVLVALGAEAGSYSRTLIDIAEMTFFRPNPALRLIGVAESKKSLEARIKHMITRPIPKSARVGAVGFLSIAMVAALLLPMAAARGPTEAPQLEANLPHGVVVELVAVCNWAEGGPVCWKPDGSGLEGKLEIRDANRSLGADDYGFVLRVQDLNDVGLCWGRIAGADGWRGCREIVDTHGSRLQNHAAAVALIEDARAETSIRVGIATGPWSTIATHEEGQMDVDQKGRVLWSPVFDTAYGISVVASRQWDRDLQQRVVAFDRNGVMHADYHGAVSSSDIYQLTARFRNLARDQIARFEYQVRRYDWIEFENISLRPGERTDVQVRRVTASGAGLPPHLPAPEDLEARAVSGTRLMDLCRAMRIYADDHDDRFPDRMTDAVNCYPINLSWLQEHVTYLGKGRTMSARPDAVLAYDKTMLAKGQGTLVLFGDGHVDFVTIGELEKSGIKPAPGGSRDARAESARRLSDLGKALLIYANDHDDRFPEQLSDMPGDLPLPVSWAPEHVAYLGKGVSPMDHPACVLAYDKTLIEEGQGTNVLYLDSHVIFETPEELERLGIRPAIQNLKRLALAALIYASEHDDTLAESLDELQPYLPRDKAMLAWVRENAEYVAGGVKMSAEDAGKPLAYERPGPASYFIAVAFMDGHVERVKGPRLKELGIQTRR
ncbi:MAG: M56 family metallopeptidase [Sedimentisphaerales bacterium]|nr:M56 family metallopeptidase [Sedimentisphaerales bacterium]